MDTEIKYGTKVKDIITGYEGIVTGFWYTFEHGTDRFMVEGIDAANRPIEWWVDAERIEVISA